LSQNPEPEPWPEIGLRLAAFCPH